MTKTIESLSILQHYEVPAETIDTNIEQEPITASRLRNEYQELRKQFRNRQLGATTLHGSHIYEDDVMATRFHAQHEIEEVWWSSADYSRNYKDGAASTLSVEIYDDEGKSARLLVGDDDRLGLELREENNGQVSWRRGSEKEIQDTAFSIMHRASNARSIHKDRGVEAREWADQHAKALLGMKYPDLASSKPSLE